MSKEVGSVNEKEHHGEGLLKVLGPIHIWALGVGIVLVGEFMGWNFTVAKGGSLGSIIACWLIGILYVSLIMINTEIGSILPEAGGQYTMAKYLMGPLAAFNIGLMIVFQYSMLEAADIMVIGQVMASLHPAINSVPWVVLTLVTLTWLNYRGAYATLTLNFVITAVAYITIFILLFGTQFWSTSSLLNHRELMSGLPYGLMGIVGALQFGVWFYLGVEGGVLAAEECCSSSRSIPLGSFAALACLLIGATITWYVCSGLVDWKALGSSVYPLYDAAMATQNSFVIGALFIGTILSCLASAIGCINDGARGWFSMSRDTLIPEWFGAIHPKYHTPYRSIMFLMPISLSFGFTGLLDQVVTFSILSAIFIYIMMGYMMFRFRKMYPLGSIDRGYICPWHPVPAVILIGIGLLTVFALYFGYYVNLLAGLTFYLGASLWFVFHRYKFVNKDKLLKNYWPRPEGF